MSYPKALTAAFAVVVVAMALMAAGSAQATVLCKTTSTPCAADYPKGTDIQADLVPKTSLSTSNTSKQVVNTCERSTLMGTTANTGTSTETVVIEVTGLFWENCINSPNTLLENGVLEFHHLSGTDNATVTAKGFTMTTFVGSFSCLYGFGEGTHIGTLTGGGEPILHLNALLPKQAGSILCPNDFIWAAEYAITGPQPIYVEPS